MIYNVVDEYFSMDFRYSKWEVLAAVMELPRVAISKCNNDEGFKLEQALAAIQFIIDMPYTLPALPDR